MKLVDILARELKEWPDTFGDVVGQLSNGSLHGYNDSGRAIWIGETKPVTLCENYMCEIVTLAQWQEAREALSKSAIGAPMPPISEAPKDATHWDPGIKCTPSWARLDGDQWFWWPVRGAPVDLGWRPYAKQAADSDTFIAIEKPWNGEGLPPVGVRIEAKHKDAQPEWARPGFYETEIVAIGKQLVIFEADGSGHEKVGKLNDYIFRPIRTPEQIAAEERSEFSYAMCKDAGHESPTRGQLAMAETLYDAGYRKVKGGEE